MPVLFTRVKLGEAAMMVSWVEWHSLRMEAIYAARSFGSASLFSASCSSLRFSAEVATLKMGLSLTWMVLVLGSRVVRWAKWRARWLPHEARALTHTQPKRA